MARRYGEGMIRRRSNGLWEARVDLGKDASGKRRRRSFYGKTRREVVDKLVEARAQVLRGDLPTAGKLTVADYLDRWLADGLGSVRPTTRENYERSVRLHLKPHLGRVTLAKLSPLHIQRAYASIERDRTRQLAHAVLHKALNQAVRWELIPRNPASLVDKPRVKTEEVNAPSATALKRLLAAAQGDRYHALYVLACFTGMRQGELFGLKWKDVDLRRRTLSVQRIVVDVGGKPVLAPPKTKKSRRKVELTDACVEALRGHRDSLSATPHGEAFVFPDARGGPTRRQNFTRRHWGPMRKKARLGRMRFHDLRHGAATLLLTAGVHPRVVQEMLGHATVTITMDTYSHVLGTLQREAADKLEDVLS